MNRLVNPVAEQESKRFEPAPRVDDLRRKRIALVWNGKQNGEVLLRCVEERLRARFPGLLADLIRIAQGVRSCNATRQGPGGSRKWCCKARSGPQSTNGVAMQDLTPSLGLFGAAAALSR